MLRKHLDARSLILEMVSAGATKVAIAKAVGVTDMTILSVAQGKTKTFRKLKKLKSVYSRWKAGKLDLSGNRGKKHAEAHFAEEAPARKKAPAKKPTVAKKSAKAMEAKKRVKPKGETPVVVSSGFELPFVTEEMVAGVEEQIWKLEAQAKFMRDLIAIRKKYGQ